MIRDTTAHRIAADWHSGQSSALYALSSSGAIQGQQDDEWDYNDAANEIKTILKDVRNLYAEQSLTNLLAYVTAKGPRPAVPGWYEQVICKAYKP